MSKYNDYDRDYDFNRDDDQDDDRGRTRDRDDDRERGHGRSYDNHQRQNRYEQRNKEPAFKLRTVLEMDNELARDIGDIILRSDCTNPAIIAMGHKLCGS